jgi:hypothetical protein
MASAKVRQGVRRKIVAMALKSAGDAYALLSCDHEADVSGAKLGDEVDCPTCAITDIFEMGLNNIKETARGMPKTTVIVVNSYQAMLLRSLVQERQKREMPTDVGKDFDELFRVIDKGARLEALMKRPWLIVVFRVTNVCLACLSGDHESVVRHENCPCACHGAVR